MVSRVSLFGRYCLEACQSFLGDGRGLQLPEGWRAAVPVDPMVLRGWKDLLDCRSVQSFEVQTLVSPPVGPALFSSPWRERQEFPFPPPRTLVLRIQTASK